MSAMPARVRVTTAAIPIAAVVLAVAGALSAVWARAGGAADPVSAASLASTITLVAVAGCVLALARPGNRVGWVMALAAAVWGAGEGSFDMAVRGIVTAPGTVPGAGALAVAGASLRAVGWFGAAVLLPVSFPDGRLPGPRWRWLAYVAAAAVAATGLGTAFAADVESTELHTAGWHNPLPLTGIGDPLASLSLLLMVVTVVGGVAALVSRFRHGDAPMRRQLLTFAAAAALPLLVVPTAFGAGWPSWIFAVSVAPLPVAVVVAILTGGVFDLATVANRSLVWVTLSAAVVGVYALVIAGTGSMLRDTHAHWLPWLGAGVVAVCFAPLRDVLQGAADRVTYGHWREPYEVLAGLSPRVGAAPGTSEVLAGVVAELHDTLGLRGAALRDTAGRIIAGSPGPESTVVPLTAYGRPAGELLFAEPASPLRPADRRVLDDLAGQLAVLMHARALTEDLRRARERLVLAREEERRRLRRDLHDGLGPALAGFMLKVDNARALVAGEPATAEHDLMVLRDDIQGTVVDVRRLVEGLRPPAIDELGLGPALTQAVNRLATRMSIDVVVADPLAAVPAAVEVAVYRIVCEAVANAVRHASARTCTVTVRVDGASLVALVSDDGVGLVPAGASRGHGLATMRERAEELGGTLGIHGGADGTMVTATLPLGAGP
jgi:signal transduction histidine kinase